MRKNTHKGILLSLLFLLLCCELSNAQTPNWDTLPWRDYADYKFQNLNKMCLDAKFFVFAVNEKSSGFLSYITKVIYIAPAKR